jgi:hypothetical protein
VNVERDVLDRLEGAGVSYYITGSEALAVWAEPRQTLDIDIVTNLKIESYEEVIRPAFDDAYLVGDLVVVGDRGYGSVIHRTEIRKADLITPRRRVRSRLVHQPRGPAPRQARVVRGRRIRAPGP